MPKTTLEMDGLFTQEDIDNRFFIMGQCKKCNEWSKKDQRSAKVFICTYCGHRKYDMKGARSIRTWLVTKDMKKARTAKKWA